ncbi:MAG: hypothetical protein IJ868_09165 [Prevotella sp.]|nr:hypothetical protein [Prevotella sp.]
MTRTLSISLNVPDSYEVEELARQLTEYGERLIARRRPKPDMGKRFSQQFLQGLSLPKGKSDRQLIDEYLEEKYGI